MSTKTEKLVNQIYDDIKCDIDMDGTFSPATLIIILPKLMQLAGGHAELDGAHKKTVVINVINRIINDTVVDDGIQGALVQLTPIAIDTMYEVWQHRYIFKEAVEDIAESCGGCCGGQKKKTKQFRRFNKKKSN